MNKIFLTLALLIGGTIAANAQMVNTGSQLNTTSTTITSYKDGAGNQWVTLTPVLFSSVRKSKVKVQYEDYNGLSDPNGVYKGIDSKSFDGVRQNKTRNINYMDQAVKLPPNTGKIQ